MDGIIDMTVHNEEIPAHYILSANVCRMHSKEIYQQVKWMYI